MKLKDHILDKSRDLFLTIGFKSVTMDDIACKMQVSKKTIYIHFKNKTKLIESVAYQLFEHTQNGVDCISQRATNPVEKLYLIEMYVMHQFKNEELLPQRQLRKYYPRIHITLRSMQYEKMQVSVLESLLKGIEEGLFKKTIDVEFLSRMYFTAMKGVKDEILFPPDVYKTRALIERYLEYHLRPIVTKKGMVILNGLMNTNQTR